jgi:HlyD family secretion protein
MIARMRGWIKRHPIWSIVIVAVSAGVLFLILKPDQPTYTYVAETVTRGDVVRKVTASGKLRALNTIKVGAEVSGQVTNVYVDFNSEVRAGQILAEIDPTRFRARVQQVEAQVSVARSALEQAEAGVVRAQTDYAIQQREFGRRSDLSRSGFISKSGLDTASGSLATARASLRTTQAQVASARASIAQANAELSSARLDLSRTRIVAATGGVVINKLVEPGTTVAASFQTPNLFEIAADTTRMQVEASVDEADIGEIRVGQSVEFTVDAYPDQKFPAFVRQIRQAATETQNVVSYLVILDVDNRAGRLLPGMTANVEVITGIRRNVMRLPTSALRFRPRAADRPVVARVAKDEGNGATRGKLAPSVYLASGDPYKPTARKIGIGLQGEDFTEVTQGLKKGDKVLIRSRTIKSAAEVDAEDENGTDDTAD